MTESNGEFILKSILIIVFILLTSITTYAPGPLFKNISPAMLKTVKPIRDVINTTVFCAAGKDQVATWYPEKRHSLFTYYFLEGLQGKADKDLNSVITVGEMGNYLKSEVKYMARRLSNRVQVPLVSGDENTIIVRLR